MKRKINGKQQPFPETEALRTRLGATERRLREADEILQDQIAKCKRAEEILEKAQKPSVDFIILIFPIFSVKLATSEMKRL